MTDSENLRRRGATLVFRRRVPGDIRTLRTSPLVQARRRSRSLWSETERLFVMVRKTPGVTREQVDRMRSLLDKDCRWSNDVALARHGRFFDHEGAVPSNADEVVLETEAAGYRLAFARNDIADV